ncbi:MAG TPA: hemerythrin domain-containing protein [Candidatus Limnocylindria bacterium]
MISGATRPIREEHRALLPHIERLRTTADEVGHVPGDVLRKKLDDAHEFLTRHLIPHAKAEDEVMYPEVARLMGAPRATATMSRDHLEVGRLTDELAALRGFAEAEPDAQRANELRRVLYGLYALVRTHFAKEEEIYLPILDERLTLAEAEDLFKEMERSAALLR